MINKIILVLVLLFSVNTITAQKSLIFERSEFITYESLNDEKATHYETIIVTFSKYEIIVESKRNFKEVLKITEHLDENNSQIFICKNKDNIAFDVILDFDTNELFVIYKPKTIFQNIIYIDLNK